MKDQDVLAVDAVRSANETSVRSAEGDSAFATATTTDVPFGGADKNLDCEEMQWTPPRLRAVQTPQEYRDERRDW